MKDGVSEWAAIAEEAEAKRDWKNAVEAWAEACSDALGTEIRDSYLARLTLAESKQCQVERRSWKPEASQQWLGVSEEGE